MLVLYSKDVMTRHLIWSKWLPILPISGILDRRWIGNETPAYRIEDILGESCGLVTWWSIVVQTDGNVSSNRCLGVLFTTWCQWLHCRPCLHLFANSLVCWWPKDVKWVGLLDDVQIWVESWKDPNSSDIFRMKVNMFFVQQESAQAWSWKLFQFTPNLCSYCSFVH